MVNVTFQENNTILVSPPKRPKRLTATRFATVMGLNQWATPFEAWCAITRTYEEPFEDTIYTVAGKVIEPKIVDYLNKTYFLDIKSADDVYGVDHFKTTYGNFFPNEKVFGGMWDAIGDDFVVEIKTTKRAEDWSDDIPIYYKLQAALYAYLLGLDKVIVTATFLEPKDYEQPEQFEPSYQNTVLFQFSMADEFPNFEDEYIQPALAFWEDHVETGISPVFDEKKDAEILKALRTHTVVPKEKEVKSMLAEMDELKVEIDVAEMAIADKKDKLKALQDGVKRYMSEQFRDGDTKVELSGASHTWSLSRSVRTTVDTKKLKDSGLFDDYKKETETLTLRSTPIEK